MLLLKLMSYTDKAMTLPTALTAEMNYKHWAGTPTLTITPYHLQLALIS